MNLPTIFFWLLFCGAYVAFIWAANHGERLLHRKNRELADVLIQKFQERLALKRRAAVEFCEQEFGRFSAKPLADKQF